MVGTSMLIFDLLYRTVPTQNQVLVPETLLKKRKSQEKARAELAATNTKRKAVSSTLIALFHTFMMHTTV